MAQTLTVREQRFINNFVSSLDATDRYWLPNLEADLASYRYPHTAAVRAKVKQLVATKRKTGTFSLLPETA